MKLRLLLLLGLLAGPAWATTLCYDTTATEDTRLNDAAAREGMTVGELIRQAVVSTIKSKYESAVHNSLSNAIVAIEAYWPGLTAAQKTAICTRLSIDVCPP